MITLPNKTRFYYDPILVFVGSALILIGYIMVVSASLHLGAKTGNLLFYPERQLIHIIIGLGVGLAVVRIPLGVWQRFSRYLFLFGLLLLLIVLIPGIGLKVNGSVRWMSILGVRVQVSEIVKLLSVVYIANYVTLHKDNLRQNPLSIINPLIVMAFAGALLMFEPDMGSTVVVAVIFMGVMFLAGARFKVFLLILLGIIVVGILSVIFEPYRLKRVVSFVNPWEDPLNSGFQLVQALMSFGRGEWLGVGLGSGVQKLFYLPEAHTDFLFSVVGEELGLLGVFSVILLFSLLFWRCFAIGQFAQHYQQDYAAFIAYGLGIWFGFQAFVNMGVNMGILPTKGLTLPFMSYGGGSMIITCCALALLFRVYSDVTNIAKSLPKNRHFTSNSMPQL